MTFIILVLENLLDSILGFQYPCLALFVFSLSVVAIAVDYGITRLKECKNTTECNDS